MFTADIYAHAAINDIHLWVLFTLLVDLPSSFETLLFFFQMVFNVSSRVTLLFEFWDVHGPVGKCVKSQRVHLILSNYSS